MKRLWMALALVSCGRAADTPHDVDTGTATEPGSVGHFDAVPITGGTLAISPDGRLAAVSDILSDRALLVDISSQVVLGHVALDPGDRPGRILVDDDGILTVSLRRGGAVARLDPLTGKVLSRTQVCPSPRGLAADGDTVWVACASGELASISAFNGELLSSAFIEHDLRDVVVDGAALRVSTFKTAELLTVTGDGQVLERRRAPVFNDAAAAADPALPFSYSPSVAWRTLPHPAGGVVMIHQRGSDRLIAPVAPEAPVRTYYGPDPVVPPDEPGRPGCRGLNHTAISWFPREGGVVTSNIVPWAFLATDGAVMPDGRYALAASGANDDLGLAADVVRVGNEIFDRTDTRCEPDEVWQVDDDSQITAVAYTADGVQLAVGRSPFRVYVGDAEIPLDLPEGTQESIEDEIAFELFQKSADSGMTCAGCHPEGLEDGRVWIFNEVGARRTQSMAGGIGDTAPFHWGGEFINFDELMIEVLVRRMGHPAVAEVDRRALQDWMHRLPTIAVTPTGTNAQRLEGQMLFQSPDTQCTVCHGGPQLTGNFSVDVGTGGELQVPTLRGVGSRGPWMHTGCATTLQDRFDPACGGDNHGQTDHLSPDQIDALVAFLQTL